MYQIQQVPFTIILLDFLLCFLVLEIESKALRRHARQSALPLNYNSTSPNCSFFFLSFLLIDFNYNFYPTYFYVGYSVLNIYHAITFKLIFILTIVFVQRIIFSIKLVKHFSDKETNLRWGSALNDIGIPVNVQVRRSWELNHIYQNFSPHVPLGL